jgi:hypothetical protein
MSDRLDCSDVLGSLSCGLFDIVKDVTVASAFADPASGGTRVPGEAAAFHEVFMGCRGLGDAGAEVENAERGFARGLSLRETCL